MSFTLEDVGVVRGERALLRSVSVEIAPGQVTAVLGPNGAGKSTLVRVLAGELAPDEGRVHLDARPLSDHGTSSLARRRAVVPQLSGLRFPFTVEEIARLGRAPHGDGEAPSGQAAVSRALERTGLVPLRASPYPQLSGGERQRVHWARAFAQVDLSVERPVPWLLLDEPTSALDLAHVHGLLDQARAFASSGGGVVLVVHDPNLALRYAHAAVLLTEGRVRAAGAASEVLSGPILSSIYGLALERIDRAGAPSVVVPSAAATT